MPRHRVMPGGNSPHPRVRTASRSVRPRARSLNRDRLPGLADARAPVRPARFLAEREMLRAPGCCSARGAVLLLAGDDDRRPRNRHVRIGVRQRASAAAVIGYAPLTTAPGRKTRSSSASAAWRWWAAVLVAVAPRGDDARPAGSMISILERRHQHAGHRRHAARRRSLEPAGRALFLRRPSSLSPTSPDGVALDGRPMTTASPVLRAAARLRRPGLFSRWSWQLLHHGLRHGLGRELVGRR